MLHSVNRADVNYPVTWLFSDALLHMCFQWQGGKEDNVQSKRDWTPNVVPIISCWDRREKEWGEFTSFILKNQKGSVRWGVCVWVWLGGMLHKPSSCSACIAWPTVQRNGWNVGQTLPPLSFFFSFFSHSVCVLFSALTVDFLANRGEIYIYIYTHLFVCRWLVQENQQELRLKQQPVVFVWLSCVSWH